MEKIKTIFMRNMETDRRVRNEVTPGCEWVFAGEGRPTRKWDGSPVMLAGGSYFKRYELKKGKAAPVNFAPAQEPDPITGDIPGWVPVTDGPADRWFRQALNNYMLDQHTGPADMVETYSPGEAVLSIPDGTYEAIGPHFQANREDVPVDILVPHGKHQLEDVPLDFDGLQAYLFSTNVEGIVWHHADGRMAKLKGRDFGYKR